MREEFANILIESKKKYPNLIVLDADCSRSTKSVIFKQDYPDSFLNTGIAEQNLISIAAGIARCGFIPIVNSFASILISRACEQIIQAVCLPNLQVIIIGHYSGISASMEGAPHHAISDIGILSSIPNISIYIPATAKDIDLSFKNALNSKSPSYIRLSRNKAIDIPTNIIEKEFEGFSLFGKFNSNFLIITFGHLLSEAFSVFNFYQKSDFPISIISIVKLNKFNNIEFCQIIKNYNHIIILEDHYRHGGLGSYINQILVTFDIRVDITHLAINDFTETGEYNWLIDKLNIGHKKMISIIDKIL